MRIFLLSVLLVSLIACSDSVESVNGLLLGDTVNIKLNETLYLDGENVSLKFDDVLQDSRCPLDVICIWEGNASVALILSENSNKHDIVLNTYRPFGRDTTINNYKITLVDVHPYPMSDNTIDKSKYSVDILLELLN